MTFGAESHEAESHRILDMFSEAGGNLVDTADVYASGRSESIVGRWLARNRAAGMKVATKVGLPLRGESSDPGGLDPSRLRACLEGSLRRLRIDHIDLYQVHVWDPLVPPEVWFGVLDELRTAGHVGAIGVCNVLGYQLAGVDEASAGTVASVQLQYNLLARQVEWEVVPCARSRRVPVLAWSPLAGGWLTGKYRQGLSARGGTRVGDDPRRGMSARHRRDVRQTWDVLGIVRALAGQYGATPAQISLAWVAAQPGVTSIVVGTRTSGQLSDNLRAAAIRLDEEALRRLDAVSLPECLTTPTSSLLTAQPPDDFTRGPNWVPYPKKSSRPHSEAERLRWAMLPDDEVISRAGRGRAW